MRKFREQLFLSYTIIANLVSLFFFFFSYRRHLTLKLVGNEWILILYLIYQRKASNRKLENLTKKSSAYSFTTDTGGEGSWTVLQFSRPLQRNKWAKTVTPIPITLICPYSLLHGTSLQQVSLKQRLMRD